MRLKFASISSMCVNWLATEGQIEWSEWVPIGATRQQRARSANPAGQWSDEGLHPSASNFSADGG